MAKGNGTAVAAFFAMALGAWLIDSGVQGRHPIGALEDIIRNPGNAKMTLAADKGKFVPVSTLIGADGSAGNNSAGIPTPSAPRNASVKQEQAYARSQFAKYGWDASQMNALIDLWNQESGWNPNAVNPGQQYDGNPASLPNHAHGIPQALGHKETDTDAWMRNWKAQIDWGLNYIKGRYGSPNAAEQHELANNWY